MPFDAPFMLGPFAVDAMGRLAPSEPTTMPAFLFRWRGRLVRARFGEAGPGRLLLRATLGRVPSTAGPHESDLRSRSFDLVRLLPRAMPASWRVVLLPDHCVRLEAETELRLPVTATDLLAELTRFLLQVAPYLDVLDEAGIAGAAFEDGNAKT